MTENNSKLHGRIKALRDALTDGLYEKDEAVRLALLTAIAGESIFFLGAPGCAKSMIARRAVQAFKADGDKKVQFFETLLNQFSTPEEVFGNISLKALNGELAGQNGKEEYRRLTENMIPEADIAFLDEIWKASPAILNTLLTIINERKFHNGSKVMNVPLKAIFAASNELPARNKGLEALYDRFIMRLPVAYVQSEDSFFEMIDASASSDFELPDEAKKLQITNEELKDWKKKIDNVSLSEEAKSVISAVRKELTGRNNKLAEENKDAKNDEWQHELFEVSDRRWKKIAHILKASAFLNGRSSVDLMDCSLIEYCIWGTEKQQEVSREIVESCIKENGLDCDSAIDDIKEQIKRFESAVTGQWFEQVEDPAVDVIVTVDGQDCYECTCDGTTETWYVSVNNGNHTSYAGYHDVYDSARNYRTNSTFTRKDDKISCWQNFTVNKHPETHLEQKKRSPIAHATVQKKFDREHYKPIADQIHSEIASLKAKKEADSHPFTANLFANQEYNTSITSKFDEAIHQLEDAEVMLDKERKRYFSPDIAAKLSLGDVILKDGTVFSASEAGGLTDAQKKDVCAVICIADEKCFALSITEDKKEWKSIREFAVSYGNSLPKAYASNWMIPDKDNLNKIWQNREEINTVLKQIGGTTQPLSEQKYWSTTPNGNSAAFFQSFDEDGEQDHTATDHIYAVRAIREWKKE